MPGYFVRISDIQPAVGIAFEMDLGETRSAAFDESLEPLAALARSLGTNMWIRLDEPSNTVTDLRFCDRGAVIELNEVEEGVSVEFTPLQSVKTLRRRGENFDVLLARLLRSLDGGRDLFIAEDDNGDIVDLSEPFEAMELQISAPALDSPDLAADVTPEQLRDLFELIRREDSGARPRPAVGIPFLYPDDGCWARAHRMAQLVGKAGFECSKIWLYGRLAVATANNPRCQVRWRYHVALLLDVSGMGEQVIDPSMFDRPVPAQTWISAQQDVAAARHRSTGSVYYRPRSGSPLSYDPDYRSTDDRLKTYCGKLLARSLRFGDPPYADCKQ